MMNINDLRDDLVRIFEGLRDGTVHPRQAIEVNNTAGKILNSLKVQIAYHALRGEEPNIPFLEVGTTTRFNKASGPIVTLPTAALKASIKPARPSRGRKSA